MSDQITIRWRRYGKGRRYRADLPDGYLETNRLSVMELAIRSALAGGHHITDQTGHFTHLLGGESDG
ncbi:hypothetical protein [Allonocardiopsis opalescens]|uniref:Uncharacterized protein n=1 Tax=Allonocardiopsis opalescens TaxID=1144618 RepID=A0A2T0PPF4_9ACTN|nr:hypothetical protein [Allonocardiopsis opalescens]PRX90688.1 hypothetical protein CLV72_11826 [Allonocardiopsis opalescens]